MGHYNKLVRDQVPGMLRASGHKVTTRTLQGAELLKALRAKLDEEIAEYDAAADDKQAALELADIVEVITALAQRRGCTEAALQQLREAKAARSGAFERGTFLVSTD
jgi:predicted house-cleaning noncanonical NTP pyrophosphatase (MazG superfamily)